MHMNVHTTRHRVAGSLHNLQVSWGTVALIAALAAMVDIFVMIMVGGAVGAIERLTPPFERWVRDSILIFPVFVLGVIGAFYAARKLVGSKQGWLKVAGTLAVIVVFTTVLGILVAAASSAYDYHLQVKLLNLSEHLRHPTYLIQDGTPVLVSGTGTCNVVCQAQHATLSAHIKALEIASVVLLVSNTVLVMWAVAIRGGRIWVPAKQRRAAIAESQRVPALTEALA
jgi:hypothetical protein